MNKSFEDWIKRVALGTVQFGLNYGISNRSGQPNSSEVKRILDYAKSVGISTLDTAINYGEAETILGKVLQNQSGAFQIISKFPKETTASALTETLSNSLGRLKQKEIYGLLAHSSSSFDNSALIKRLIEEKQKGRIQKIGVSIYSPSEIRKILDQDIDIDLVQLPYNVFDQRFKPLLGDLRRKCIEVHVRSVFLQGLFFLNPKELPPHFNTVKNKLHKLQDLAKDLDIPLHALLLNYTLGQSDIDKVVIGVNTLQELQGNISAFNYAEETHQIQEVLDSFSEENEEILLPMNWG